VKGSSFSRNIPSSSSSSISTSAVSVQCEPADDMIEVMQKMFEVICENGDQSMFTRIEADGFCHVFRGINMKFSPKSNLILLHKSHMKTMRVTENLKFNGIVSRTLFRYVTQEGFTIRDLALVLGITKSAAQRWQVKYRANQNVYKPSSIRGGRVPILDKEQRANAKRAVYTRTLEGAGFSMVGSFISFLEPYVRATLRTRCEVDWETVPLPYTPESYDKLYRVLCDGKRRQADQADLAMFRQRSNLAAYIVEYCVRIAAMTDKDGIQIVLPALCFNNDDTRLPWCLKP